MASKLSAKERDALLASLKARFDKHPDRHAGITWQAILDRIGANAVKLKSLQAMEQTGGQPDVIGRSPDGNGFLYCDCSPESPQGRRSTCFDPEALKARKQYKPKDSAVGMATGMGIALLTEAQYRHLQTLSEFDTKTSSWIAKSASIRKLDGALFCDRRYDAVFVYHNGAQSYYAARGFRGQLVI